jgi:SAM-dependent methyltransferase
MEAHVYEQFARLQESHFWFRGRRAIFFDLIERALARGGAAGNGNGHGRELLEIGCGAGGMLAPLARYGRVTGLDIAVDYLQHCKSRGFPRMVAGSGYELPFADGGFDVVALFDTIEHIPDDRRVLEEVKRVLRPGGIVFVSVPAYQFLYSQNDRVVHHQRRYTARGLRRVLEAAGLRPQKVTYFNTFLFPLILPAVLVLKLKERLVGLAPGQTHLNHQFVEPVNDLFAGVMSSERFWLRNMEFPFGHSLIGIAG